ncbi:MAG TPA: ABC-F family ATP-binding cassette domain-containing protein [Anaeromyxobacteraceae bacterium]|nr:ABC-F family ATP-binding cassette domain-containing protein [Anaeromyxobacteraceae bacterium]
MSLVSARDLSLAFGADVLFDGASFSIGPHDRAGLVGPNGTGKSSLLRILAGQVHADGGSLTFRRGARVGYLPQEVASMPEAPAVEAVLASVPGRDELESRLRATEAALASPGADDPLELSESLAELHDELAHFEERFGRHRAEQILAGLGFDERAMRASTRALSGGWRMRVALAGLLLQDPDLLLLDEPTNHLDVPTLAWFEDFLRSTRKALVLVSHDRLFLNRQVERILSLEPEGVRAWAGDYDAYRRQRAEEEELLVARARRQDARRAQLEAFIERFGAKNTKAAQARSKRKVLERMEAVEVREERETVLFRFPEAPRSGREVLRLEGVSKSYGPLSVYRNLDAQVLRGERVAVIGPNGAGKSTLLKLAAGELAPDAGRVRFGHGVVAGYYAQHHFERDEHAAPGAAARTFGTLDPERTVLETLWGVVPEKGEAYVRGVAGSFLFSGDAVDKPVGVLSGGERSRVALAKLLLRPTNLLLLDEPTNHLDIESSEALIDSLSGYGGTLVFVSHNRSFVDRLATAVWEVRNGGVAPFPGNLADWLYHQRATGPAPAAAAVATAGPAATGKGADRERRRAEAEARNARYRIEKPVRDRLADVEARISEWERTAAESTRALADPSLYEDFSRARPHLDARRRAEAELAPLYAEWEELSRELERLADGAGDTGPSGSLPPGRP